MKVLLLSRYSWLGASSRVRSYQYLPYLSSHGVNVTVAPLLGDDYVRTLYHHRRTDWKSVIQGFVSRVRHLINGGSYDLLWIEYELFPWFPALVERLLAKIGMPYVVDYDDAVFHNYDLHRHPAVRWLLGRKIDHVMRGAAAVIAGNSYLGDRCIRAGAKQVVYLPSVVDPIRYTLATSRPGNPFTIGWMGSPATVRFLEIVRGPITEFLGRHHGRFVVVGAGKFDIPGVPVELRPWVEATEVEDIRNFDVGIMPLPDGPWERGKCGYKLIQYMACGIAVVASPVGVNREIVEEGVNGFLAWDQGDWVRALESLYVDPDLRTRMGLAGRRIFEERYSLPVAAPLLLETLRDAARR